MIDWNEVNKKKYLSAMERSVVKDVEIKYLLKSTLTNKIENRTVFMRGIHVSYYFEDYSEFKAEDLQRKHSRFLTKMVY